MCVDIMKTKRPVKVLKKMFEPSTTIDIHGIGNGIQYANNN